METWYRLDGGVRWGMEDNFMIAVEVTRHTDKTIWLKCRDGSERRTKIKSSWESYYPTFEEAVAKVSSVLQNEVEEDKDALKASQERLQLFSNWLRRRYWNEDDHRLPGSDCHQRRSPG